MTQTKEERAKYLRDNYKKTPQYKKCSTISEWKRIRKTQKGLPLLWDTQEEIDEIYERYLNSKKCEKCNKKYTKKNKKCMDHNHNTGKFRNILCNNCNCKTDRQIPNNNTSGIMNISFDITNNEFRYRKCVNGKTFYKGFETKQEAIDFKIEYEQNLKI